MRKVDILGIQFDNIDIVEAVEHVMRRMDSHTGDYILVPSYSTVLASRKNRKLRRAMNGADMVLPCGAGIIAASHILGSPLMQEISGEVFASALLARMSDCEKTVYIVGEDASTGRAAQTMERRYPGIKIAGFSDERLADDEHIAAAINESSPDLVFVGLAGTKQELWISRSAARIKAGVIAGFGDVLAGYAGYDIPKTEKAKNALIDFPGVLLSSVWQRLTGET